MDAGVCGLPGLHAVLNAVRRGLRQEIELATIRPHKMEETIVLEKESKNMYAINLVQWMEVGGPGVPTLPAARSVVAALKEDPDSVTTHAQPMVANCAQGFPMNMPVATLTRVLDMEAGDPGEVGPPAPQLAAKERRQEQDYATTPPLPLEEPSAQDLLLNLQNAMFMFASVGLLCHRKFVTQTQI